MVERSGPANHQGQDRRARGARTEAALVGKFLLGALSGGALVIGALVVGSALFPPSENRATSAVDAAAVAAPEPVVPLPDVTPGTAEPAAEAPRPGDLASELPGAAPVQPRQLDPADRTAAIKTPAARPEVVTARPEGTTETAQVPAQADATEAPSAPDVTVTPDEAPAPSVPLMLLPQPSFDAVLAESAPEAPAPADAAPAEPGPAEPAPAEPAPAEPAPAASLAELLPAQPEGAEAPATPAEEIPAAPPVEPLPEIAQIEPPEAAAPDQVTPPDPQTVRLPGTQAPAMPGSRPKTLPGAVVTVDPPEAEPAAAEPAAAEPSPAEPAPAGVVTNRLPRIGDDPMTAAAADPAATADNAVPADDPRPVARFAAPFDNPGDRPLLAVVLIDSGAPDLDRTTLAALPFPVSFALDPMDPASAEHAALYRQSGKEVIMLATGVAEGAQASDIEVAFQAMSQGLPEAVAVMDLADPAFQDNRPLASIVVPVVQGEGRGLLTWDRGLNAADQVARRDGVPAATVFRDISAAAGDKFGMRRLMDRAMFKAVQDGRATVVGAATADLAATLLEWTLEGRGASVTLAPLSAVLTVN